MYCTELHVHVYCIMCCRGSQLERIARVGVTGVNNVHRIKKWIGQYISVYLSISQYVFSYRRG